MTSPVYGFILEQTDSELSPVSFADMSIVGWCLPSNDASASVFPLNTPVAINSGDPAALTAAGSGPLYDCLSRLNANLADLEVNALVIVVRVSQAFQNDGVTEDIVQTTANIIGNQAAGTGIYAFLRSAGVTGYTPRLIGAPGYTGWTNYSVTAPVIGVAGTNYTHPLVTFNPAGATATATVGNLGVTALAGTVTRNGSNVITAIALASGGQNYGAVPTVTITGGGGTGATAHATIANGIVTGIVVDSGGTGYTSNPTVTLAAPVGGQIASIVLTNPGNYAPGVTPTITIADSAGGVGTGATASITMQMLANPICAALPQINSALLAHSIVGGPGTTKAAAVAWRTTLADQRTIPVDNWEIVTDGVANAYIDGAAGVFGLAVRTDFQHAGYPGWSFSNQPVQGIVGLKRVDAVSLLDGATDGEQLLALGIGITSRGDLSDTAVASSGFVHTSWMNAGIDPNYNFYNKTRMRDFTNLALIKSMRNRLGKENVTVHSVRSVLNDMEAIMTDLKLRQCVIDFRIGFSASDNTIAGLRAGKFTVFDNSEEPAPILVITIKRGLDEDALTAELAALAATTPSLALS